MCIRDSYSAAGFVIVIIVRLAVPVHKGCPGINVIVRAEHQIDIIVGGNAGQIFLCIGMAVLSRIG